MLIMWRDLKGLRASISFIMSKYNIMHFITISLLWPYTFHSLQECATMSVGIDSMASIIFDMLTAAVAQGRRQDFAWRWMELELMSPCKWNANVEVLLLGQYQYFRDIRTIKTTQRHHSSLWVGEFHRFFWFWVSSICRSFLSKNSLVFRYVADFVGFSKKEFKTRGPRWKTSTFRFRGTFDNATAIALYANNEYSIIQSMCAYRLLTSSLLLSVLVFAEETFH